MRMDQSAGKSAYDVINTYSEAELYRVIKDYGEERWASRIAEFIVRERQQKPISHTAELVSVIKRPYLQEPVRMGLIRQSGRSRQSGLKSMMNWEFSMTRLKRLHSG